MPGTFQRPFSALDLITGIRRQATPGTPATNNLIQVITKSVTPDYNRVTSNLGYEQGAGIDVMNGDVTEYLDPKAGFKDNMYPGAFGMIQTCAGGFMILTTATAASSGPVSTTLQGGGLTSRHQATITVASATGLVIGDVVQIGALVTPGTPILSDRCETHQITGISGNVLTFGNGKTLYKYPATSTTVVKIDKTAPRYHYFLPITAANQDAGSGDLFTFYHGIQNNLNGSGASIVGLMYDGLMNDFSPVFQDGNPPNMTANAKFAFGTKNSTFLSGLTTIPDPLSAAAYATQNSNSSFSIMGDTVNGPTNVSFQQQSPVFDNVQQGSVTKKTPIIQSHAITGTLSGVLLATYFNNVFYNGNTATDLSAQIYQGSLSYLGQSGATIGTSGINFAFGLVANTVQYKNYTMSYTDNNVPQGELTFAVIPEANRTNNFYWVCINNIDTDVACAL